MIFNLNYCVVSNPTIEKYFMINTDKTVAAVVVTYNRKNLLKECLDALLVQTRPLDSILVVDNASSDGTTDFLEQSGYMANSLIQYVRLPENIGGAGGFNYGIKQAYKHKFHWVWVMDDDAEPMPNALETLLDHKNLAKLQDVGALANLVVNPDKEIDIYHQRNIDFKSSFPLTKPLVLDSRQLEKPIKIDFSSFVGLLISRSVIEKIGLPDKRFFIYHDDVDYCIRINNVSNIYLIPKSIIIHKYLLRICTIKRNIFGIELSSIPLKNFKFEYYNIRNLVFVLNKYKLGNLKSYSHLFFEVLKDSLGVFLYDDHKITRLIILWKALFDGLSGRFDNSFVTSIYQK